MEEFPTHSCVAASVEQEREGIGGVEFGSVQLLKGFHFCRKDGDTSEEWVVYVVKILERTALQKAT